MTSDEFAGCLKVTWRAGQNLIYLVTWSEDSHFCEQFCDQKLFPSRKFVNTGKENFLMKLTFLPSFIFNQASSLFPLLIQSLNIWMEILSSKSCKDSEFVSLWAVLFRWAVQILVSEQAWLLFSWLLQGSPFTWKYWTHTSTLGWPYWDKKTTDSLH